MFDGAHRAVGRRIGAVPVCKSSGHEVPVSSQVIHVEELVVGIEGDQSKARASDGLQFDESAGLGFDVTPAPTDGGELSKTALCRGVGDREVGVGELVLSLDGGPSSTGFGSAVSDPSQSTLLEKQGLFL